jgi:hypothetical protein
MTRGETISGPCTVVTVTGRVSLARGEQRRLYAVLRVERAAETT